MARRRTDPKTASLRRHGCLYRRPEAVRDALFLSNAFFDPRDLLQVKYEMLRRVHAEGLPVSRSAALFGLSRPTFYQAQRAYEVGGLPGLLPQKPGPRQRHKLGEEVLAAVRAARAETPALSAQALVELVRDRFGLSVHRRSIERALGREKKHP